MVLRSIPAAPSLRRTNLAMSDTHPELWPRGHNNDQMVPVRALRDVPDALII